jgi:predicted ATPase
VLAEAQALADESNERWWQAELFRLKGELILKRSSAQNLVSGDGDEAEGCFRQARDFARAQKARSLELRAAMSMGRLLIQQSRRSEARQILKEVLTRFTEGFDTPDLLDAKLMMEEL